MSATTHSHVRALSPDALQAAFLAILPRIERHARIVFRDVRCAVQQADCIAETIALAWHWYVRLVRRGKAVGEFVSALARFAAASVKNGRRLCGQERANDVLSGRAQRHHTFAVAPLPVRSTLEGTPLQEALHDNRQSPVPDQAAFRIDFPEWLRTLTDRDRRLVQDLAVGHRAQDLARKYGVSPSRVSRQRRAFRDDWLQFQGDLPAAQGSAEGVEAKAACRQVQSRGGSPEGI